MLLGQSGEYITQRVNWPFHQSSCISESHELAETSVNIITFGVSHKVMKTYCGIFAQWVAKQGLSKQTSTEILFSMRSVSQTWLRNAEVNTSLQQLVDMQE
jgi:hypothetical protein